MLTVLVYYKRVGGGTSWYGARIAPDLALCLGLSQTGSAQIAFTLPAVRTGVATGPPLGFCFNVKNQRLV
uniref:Uncharacterized protein n=1 Tax=Anguilla anguilla TaxID=7936 RepID=A0A0E9TY36_ANGAN